jgi:hypothetical protein
VRCGKIEVRRGDSPVKVETLVKPKETRTSEIEESKGKVGFGKWLLSIKLTQESPSNWQREM